MARVVIDMSISLDGFIAGPNDGPQLPLGGRGGEQIFNWYFRRYGDSSCRLELSGVIHQQPVVSRKRLSQ